MPLEATVKDRVFGFLDDVTHRQATRVLDVAPGVEVVLNDDFPVSHVQNLVLVTSGARTSSVAAGLDRLTTEGRHPHVHILSEEALGLAEVLGPDLRDRGLKAEELEILVHTAAPERAAPPDVDVREVTGDLLDPHVLAQWRADLPDASAETVQQLVDRRAAYAAVTETTFLATFRDGLPASRATLYRNAGVGEIDDVNTLPQYQGGGLATAVVLRAVELLRGRGCDLVFLEAAVDDWPRELYLRLGFTHLAPLPTFTGVDG
jgi:GNAT superfamily N-acetyltransferase